MRCSTSRLRQIWMNWPCGLTHHLTQPFSVIVQPIHQRQLAQVWGPSGQREQPGKAQGTHCPVELSRATPTLVSYVFEDPSVSHKLKSPWSTSHLQDRLHGHGVGQVKQALAEVCAWCLHGACTHEAHAGPCRTITCKDPFGMEQGWGLSRDACLVVSAGRTVPWAPAHKRAPGG